MSSAPAVESLVEFLNVDLEVHGARDHSSLIQAFGNAVFVVAESEGFLSFEVNDGPRATLVTKLEKLVALLSALSAEPRAVLDSAKSRVLNIGIQSGLGPPHTEWSIPATLLSELTAFSVALTVTVYGAEVVQRTT